MAYGLRYQLKFKDIKNNDVKINFLLKDYTGTTVTQITGSGGNELKLKRNLGSGGEPTYIDSHEFTIEFIPTSTINLNTFRSRSNKKWKVEIVENYTTIYNLWLINTDARQPLNILRGEPVRLTATDGLGLLKSEKLATEIQKSVWVNSDTGEYIYTPDGTSVTLPPVWVEEKVTLEFPLSGEITYIEAIRQCLLKVGFELELVVTFHIYVNWLGGPSWTDYYLSGELTPSFANNHTLHQVKIYASLFEGKSVYDILLLLCKNINCFISQYEGRWHLWRPNDLYYEKFVRTVFNPYGYPVYWQPARPILTAGKRSVTDKLYYVNNNHESFFFEPYKSLTTSCKYGAPIQLIDKNYFSGQIGKYVSVGQINLDVIKEYGLMAYKFDRQGDVPYGYIQLPDFTLNPGESFDFECLFKNHGENKNQLCFEIVVTEQGLTSSGSRVFRYTNFKALDDGDEYSTRANGYKAAWVGRYRLGSTSNYAHVGFEGEQAIVYNSRAWYMVESVNTNFEADNPDYQKYTLNVPAISIPYNVPLYTQSGVTYYIQEKLKPAICTIRIYSMITYQDGNIEPSSSISVGGFDIRKHSNREFASDNCKIEAPEQCDYSPETVELSFVDDALSENYTHKIGNGSQLWRRTGKNTYNQSLFEALAEDRFNLRMHDVPNIEGDFMFNSGMPVWDRFAFAQFPNAKFIPWDVEINFQQKTCSGLFVPIMDVDSNHRATFYEENSNGGQEVYLRKNITIT